MLVRISMVRLPFIRAKKNPINMEIVEAGQGSLPEIPVVTVPCERCAGAMEVKEGKLPLLCPHCHYHVRPVTDSMLSNFLFVLKHRLFTWRGRCTRKEYWSYSIISSILCTIGVVLILTYAANNENEFLLYSIPLYLLCLGIPQIFLIARRLHDISLSGITVIIHMLLMMVMMLVMGFTLYWYNNSIDANFSAQVTSYVSTPTEYSVTEQTYSYTKPADEDLLVADEQIVPIHFILISTFLNMGVTALNVFFLVICFINSSRGTNKYGPSRKYPLGA